MLNCLVFLNECKLCLIISHYHLIRSFLLYSRKPLFYQDLLRYHKYNAALEIIGVVCLLVQRKLLTHQFSLNVAVTSPTVQLVPLHSHISINTLHKIIRCITKMLYIIMRSANCSDNETSYSYRGLTVGYVGNGFYCLFV